MNMVYIDLQIVKIWKLERQFAIILCPRVIDLLKHIRPKFRYQYCYNYYNKGFVLFYACMTKVIKTYYFFIIN